MILLSKLSNLPDELSENDELREFELSGSDCIAQPVNIYKGVLNNKKMKCLLIILLVIYLPQGKS